MTVQDEQPEVLASGPERQGAGHLHRLRRLSWLAVGLLAAAAVVAVLVPGDGEPHRSRETRTAAPALPPEPVGTVLLLDERHGRSGHVDLRDGRTVVEIECVGPGSVLVRLNARSLVTQACAVGRLSRVQRALTPAVLDELDPRASPDVLVTVSTVGTSEASRWRVSAHPPVDAPA